MSSGDEDRVCYLLLRLGVPSDWHRPERKHLAIAMEAGKAMGATVRPIRLKESTDERYLFHLPDYARDDMRAIRLAESVLYGVTVASGSFMDPRDTAVIFRVPASMVIDESETLGYDKLVQLNQDRMYEEGSAQFELSELVILPGNQVAPGWEIARVILHEYHLFRAARFLKTCIDDFPVSPYDVPAILDDPERVAYSGVSGVEQNKLENSLENAFKTVEAILGDPPKDDRKLFAKIRSIGLESDMKVGYQAKVPLHKVIRDMSLARDKKAAHGSTSARTITVGQLLEFQVCARMIFLATIEQRLGRSVF